MAKEKKGKIEDVAKEEVKPVPEKINLNTFVAIERISWQLKARLELLIETKEISIENDLEKWKKIIKKI